MLLAATTPIVEMLALGFAAVAAIVLVSELVDRPSPRVVALLQAFTPQLTAVALVMSLAFAVAGRFRAAAVVGGVGAVGIVLVVRAVRRPRVTSGHDGDTGARDSFRCAAVNVLYRNERIDEVGDTLAEIDSDVVVLTELTAPQHERLSRHPVAATYPTRIEFPAEAGAGIAVWSRLPAEVDGPPPGQRGSLAVRIQRPAGDDDSGIGHPSGTVRLLAVHPYTPVESAPRWRGELDRIAEVVRDGDDPLLVIGDFNATYWHPEFARIVDGGGTDAHVARRRGLTMSWPAGGARLRSMRLDHAVVRGLEVVDVQDFRVPGSDHVGFVVTVR